MGTRQVYEEKLRRANLEYDPTMNPGLGSARCPRCLSLLTPNSEKGEWTITPVLHDAAAVAGSGIGGLLSAVNAFNTGIPYLQNRFPGSKRLSFLVGVPLLLGYSGLGAAFGGNIILLLCLNIDYKLVFSDLYHWFFSSCIFYHCYYCRTFYSKCTMSFYQTLLSGGSLATNMAMHVSLILTAFVLNSHHGVCIEMNK
ncbi:uncharacterized protein LOC103858003 isoform X1 [Brassica rapa]|uniref:uncharacterized protein LOC103858003 isoform X1 n=1 Tax=Brassica campestris TaxID=3711 RepID=UPI00142DC083|nr:uncharacterized protein LOC103858003 isoform X1 [Brassica rapa]